MVDLTLSSFVGNQDVTLQLTQNYLSVVSNQSTSTPGIRHTPDLPADVDTDYAVIVNYTVDPGENYLYPFIRDSTTKQVRLWSSQVNTIISEDVEGLQHEFRFSSESSTSLEFYLLWSGNIEQGKEIRIGSVEFNVATGGGDDHGGDHAHGSGVEWFGNFDLPAGRYTLKFSKVDNQYGAPDSTIKIVFNSITTLDNESDLESAGILIEHGTPVEKGNNEIITPGSICYNLTFDQSANTTCLLLDVPSEGLYGIYLQHVPSEFDTGFFNESFGRVTPVYQEPVNGYSNVASYSLNVGGKMYELNLTPL